MVDHIHECRRKCNVVRRVIMHTHNEPCSEYVRMVHLVLVDWYNKEGVQ